jgi:hypothetical protein
MSGFWNILSEDKKGLSLFPQQEAPALARLKVGWDAWSRRGGGEMHCRFLPS